MGLVKLVQGLQFKYQNVFRTISFGFAPFLPMTQSYRMSLDGEFSQQGSGYFALYPQEYSSANDNRSGYPWMQRRFAYNAGGSGRLSTLNTYSRQKLALANTPDTQMEKSSTALGLELQRVLEGLNYNPAARQFQQSDIAELEMLILGRYVHDAQSSDRILKGGGPMDILTPNQYRKNMGIDDNTFKQLSSQSFDMYFRNEPGIKKLVGGILGEAGGGTEANENLNKSMALEMTAASTKNKYLTKGIPNILSGSVETAEILSDTTQKNLDKINTMLVKLLEGVINPQDIKADVGRPTSQNQITLGGQTIAGPLTERMEVTKWLWSQIKAGSVNSLQSEGRRVLSRAFEMQSQQIINQMGKTDRWLEQFNLRNMQGFAFILPEYIKMKIGERTLPVPQFKVSAAYAIAAKSLAQAARNFARENVFANNKNINKHLARIQQLAIDESVKTQGRISSLSQVQLIQYMEEMVGGAHINVGDAGGYPGVVGLTTTSVAKGLQVQIQRILNSGVFQKQFGDFYNRMMSESNRLSTHWKDNVPTGTTSQSLISKEWTFGDDEGNPRKHYLGIWGPTGEPEGDYNNWKDSNRREGANVSISPFLTARRSMTGAFPLKTESS
jgi:hypothetical protein